MIAKHVITKNDGKSNFAALVNYIVDDQGNEERVAMTHINGCLNDDIEWAIKEVLATQQKNTTSKADKSYHLVVSFPENERPSAEQLADIEQTLADGIGLGSHQRVSAIHDDTRNLHMHIAINKVHPESFRMIEPYFDHYRLGELCQALEVRHGLEADNHLVNGLGDVAKLSPKERDMRAHGLVTFGDWLRKELTGSPESWKELHKSLASLGVVIKGRGAGLVFEDKFSGVRVKASSVNREYSKAALVKKLGAFEKAPPGLEKAAVRATYSPEPGAGLSDTGKLTLYSEYVDYRERLIGSRDRALVDIQQQKEKALDKAKKNYDKQRENNRLGRMRSTLGNNRRSNYSVLKLEYKDKHQALLLDYRAQAKALRAKYDIQSWREWLKTAAQGGSEEALRQLRELAGGKPKAQVKGNAIEGEEDSFSILSDISCKVQRNGDVFYFLKPGSRVVDKGLSIELVGQVDEQSVKRLLKLAKLKFGSKLEITGESEFLKVAGQLAPSMGIQFTNNLSIEQYVKERNEKCEKGLKDVLPHKAISNAHLDSEVVYRGQRKVGNATLGLYEQKGTILVAQLSIKESASLKRQRLGTKMTIKDKGFGV